MPKPKLKKSSSAVTRLKISTLVMRQLLFASGGRCAMTNCGLSLISPSGGWIGTVAHIVGAETNGPRGAGSMSPEDRRSFGNLILMCATHGREVDAQDTGEALFPVDMLRIMKAAHEAKISEAVMHAIEEELTGVRTATGVVDTALRSATAASTGAGLFESMMLDGDADEADLIEALAEAKSCLQRLSQPAVDTLSQLLGVWLLHCHIDQGGGYDFGDSGRAVSLSYTKVDNRIMVGMGQSFALAEGELKVSGVLSEDADEFEHNYYFDSPWSFAKSRSLRNFWVEAAEFLYYGHAVEIQDWVKTLDFSIFDRVASPNRDVPWR